MNATESTLTAAGLTPEQRERLACLADTLIPGGDGLPSASVADVHGKWIDRAAAAAPGMATVLPGILARDGDPEAVLEQLRSDEPVAFGTFTLLVAGSYFLNPKIRKALGYPGVAPQRTPALPDESDYYLEGDLVGPVVARGPIYRPIPDEGSGTG